MNVGALSVDVHSEFEVPVTVSRAGALDRAERAVLHLDSETWQPDGDVQVLIRADMLSVLHGVDLQEGDRVTCDDPSAVPSSRCWVVTSRKPEGDDHWIKTFYMKASR